MPEYDPFAYALQEDPYPTYAHLRDESPLYFSRAHGFWALSRYADVRRALRDADRFSSARVLLEDISEFARPMIVGMDEPDHSRLRDLLKRRWTRRRMFALERRIRALARGFVAEFAERGRADVMAELAARLPLTVICELLAVPGGDRAYLRERADALLARDDGAPAVPEASRQAFLDVYAYFEALIAARGSLERDDVLGALVAAEREELISRDELLGYCFLLIVAGNETTMHLIGNLVHQLDAAPAVRARLARERAAIPRAIEESLRHDTPVPMRTRSALCDLELHDQKIHAGDTVALLLGSANRDERQFAEPDRFDPGRDASGHLGFGLGAHFCLGASLARLEARIALEELLARIPEYRVDPAGVRRVHTPSVRGFARLPIEFQPRAAAARH